MMPAHASGLSFDVSTSRSYIPGTCTVCCQRRTGAGTEQHTLALHARLFEHANGRARRSPLRNCKVGRRTRPESFGRDAAEGEDMGAEITQGGHLLDQARHQAHAWIGW
jgi:hypothetical protein